MARDARFWRNVTIIALAHIAVLVGLIRWSREVKRPKRSEIVWMESSAGNLETLAVSTTSLPNESESLPAPTPEPIVAEEPVNEPSIAPVKSEIERPRQTPTPPPVETATPTATAAVTPKPTPKPVPSATAKAKPKTTPRKKPLVAKTTPKPTSESKNKDADGRADGAGVKKKEIAKLAQAKKGKADASDRDPHKSGGKVTNASGSANKGSSGSGGAASEFGWYGNMLHDRFYSEWVQPMTVVASGVKLSALVKLRIEKDGRVSDFSLIRPSGNVVVDESVAAVAKRVTQVDPLPVGLGGEYYEVKINFELNSE